MKKLLVCVSLVMTISLLMAGCSNGTTPTTTATTAKTDSATTAPPDKTSSAESTSAAGAELEGNLIYWSMWNEAEPQGIVTKAVADEFMALHPKVKITIQFSGRDINKTLKPALDGGEVIDIFDFPINTAVEEHALDLTKYVQQVYPSTDGQTLADTLLPSMLVTPKTQTKDATNLLAIGYQPWMCSFMYNAKIFDDLGIAPPSTWEELDAACQKIKDSGVTPITFDDAYALLLPGMYLAREKDPAFIADLLNDTTGDKWSDPAVLKMAKAFEDFAKKGYFDKNVGGNKWPAGQQDVGHGTVAMCYNATWLPNELRDLTGDDFAWGAFTFPDTVAGQTKSKTEEAFGSGMLSINKKTANPDLAMEFLAFTFSKANDQKMSAETISIPSTKAAQWPATLAAIQPAFEKIDTPLKWAGGLDQNPDLTPIISENFTKLAAGQITADQFVSNMVAAVKK